MPKSASSIFEFLEDNKEFRIDRYELACTAFSKLRRSLRNIVMELNDSFNDQAIDISYQLRASLSEWLTVPVPFDRLIADAIFSLFGEAEMVKKTWGSDISQLYNTAMDSTKELISDENPMRTKVKAVIDESRDEGSAVKIFCHPRARSHFESIFSGPEDLQLEDDMFLHSIKDYRETAPFDLLMKVGAFRPRGWGWAPDAVLTAPVFGKLAQIVWSGCNDEADFGYDPGDLQLDISDQPRTSSPGTPAFYCGSISWNRRIFRFGEDLSILTGEEVDADELHLFREIARKDVGRPAVFFQIGESHGIFYRPNSRILSFDPDITVDKPVDTRVPGETLLEGLFLILPFDMDIDSDVVKAEHGYYSRVWKSKLEQEITYNSNTFIARLRAAGLNLVHLKTAINHWCKPPSTVIHAPQQVRHFKILLDTLGVINVEDKAGKKQTVPWWQKAWNEVRRSRGEAIHAGFQAQELAEEYLIATLNKSIHQIRKKASESNSFFLDIHSGGEPEGKVFFFKVWNLEEGFRVPEGELKTIKELDAIDQWRE